MSFQSVTPDHQADHLVRTTNLVPYNSNYTWMCWLMLYGRFQWNPVMQIIHTTGSASQENDDKVVVNGNMDIAIVCRKNGGGQTSWGTRLQAGRWYHVTMMRDSTTTLRYYANGVLDATATTASVSDRSAQEFMYSTVAFNSSDGYDGGLHGEVAVQKIWTTNLSVAEIRAEMYTVRPQRMANLHAWYPHFPGATERLRDYSANKYDWTENGTPTDGDNPPVAFGAPSAQIQYQEPAAGGTLLVLDPRTGKPEAG